jgi:hypothetical protein
MLKVPGIQKSKREVQSFMALKVKKQPAREGDSAASELVRRFKANPAIFIGTVVILVIVIVAFVFVPAIVPSAGGFGADLTFGFYEKTPITYRPGNFFAQKFDEYAQQIPRSGGSDTAFENFQVWQNSFYAAVVHTAIIQEVRQAGYEPPVELINREVAQLFQVNGRFDAAAYRRLSNTRKMALWRDFQDTLIIEKYLRDQYELVKPAGEEDFVAGMAAARRSFEGAAFNLRDYPDTELRTYAAQNSPLFTTLHLSRITVTAGEREARQILASVREGSSSFEDAARNQSQDSYADRGGDMGTQMAYELSALITNEAERSQVLSLSRGEISDLISLGESWAFFRAEEDPVPLDLNNSAQGEQVRSYLLLFERGRMVDYFIRRAEELRARAAAGGEGGFDEALREAGLEKFSFGPLAVNYGNLEFFPVLRSVEGFSDTILANFAVTESFWETAFHTPPGTVSEPLELGDQVLVLLPREAEEPGDEDESTRLSFQYYSQSATRNIDSFFIQSPKLKNQFWETYSRYLLN